MVSTAGPPRSLGVRSGGAACLIAINRDGKKIAAVAQITKMGLLFLFDRENGKAGLSGWRNVRCHRAECPGERSRRPSPFPVKPPPLSLMLLKKEEIYNKTPEHASFWQRALAEAVSCSLEGAYTPMPVEGCAHVSQHPGRR